MHPQKKNSMGDEEVKCCRRRMVWGMRRDTPSDPPQSIGESGRVTKALPEGSGAFLASHCTLLWNDGCQPEVLKLATPSLEKCNTLRAWS